MRRIAFAVGGLVAAVLVGGQFALPLLAERRIERQLRDTGEVRRVSVSAFPAVKLLFKRADRIEIEMGDARAGTGRLAKLLRDARGVGELDARVQQLRLGPLLMRDLRLAKDGPRLDGEAAVTDADLTAALPSQFAVRPVDTGDGQLVLEGNAGPFSARARLVAQDGAVVIAPEGLLGALGTLTVFRDRGIEVVSVGSEPRAGGFTLRAEGLLAGG